MKKTMQVPQLQRPLPCAIEALSAFLFSVDTFILSKKDGSLARYTPATLAEAEAVTAWLRYAGVRDLNK